MSDSTPIPRQMRLDAFSRRQGERSFVFAGLSGALAARRAGEVRPLLRAVEERVGEGLHAVGYLSYEAAAGLDPALRTQAPAALPLAFFAFYAERRAAAPGEGLEAGPHGVGSWRPSIERPQYEEAIAAIRRHLVAGDTYQVNFTFRLRAPFRGEPQALYAALGRAQQAPFAAYFDLGRHVLVSASPELCWRRRGGVLEARPMKGTGRRGRWSQEDRALAEALRRSPKERAENVMITDMVRNDLGRISEAGSVEVPQLFRAERYPTLWQLTSTVRSRLRAGVGLAEIFAALFPCASVTGAPKVRTMQIIRDLEQGARGLYTGCMGYVSPGPEACFNVAIRSAHLDRQKGVLEYGVGGGITWGSSAALEYEECLLKAQVLEKRRPDFQLLETLLWEEGAYYLLERHLARLAASAEYWGFACELARVRASLEESARTFGRRAMRVRLLLAESGDIEVQAAGLRAAGPLRARLATAPVDSADPLLYHKTTQRALYEGHLRRAPPGGEVLLYNERGELTEFCRGNLVVELDGRRCTPPISCGLLAGTFRAELLQRGEIEERRVRLEDLQRARHIYLINSVRRFAAVELI